MTRSVILLLAVLVVPIAARITGRQSTVASRGRLERPVPVFADTYQVEGVIALPYAEIREPFIGYYDSRNGRSRVDYYGDLVLTVQRGDVSPAEDVEGVNYKISYMVNSSGVAERVCFQVNGSAESPVKPQNVIPDLSEFTYQVRDSCPDWYGYQNKSGPRVCEKWVRNIQFLEKESKYSFWLRRDSRRKPIPIHYVMLGYNTLFGSHYDEYKVSYRNYQPTDHILSETFDVASNFSCRSFPGPGNEHVSLHNPINEFMQSVPVTRHIDQDFERFKDQHGKTYASPDHEAKKKTNFLHNHRFIHSMNRKNQHFKLAINHFADFAPHELKHLRGRRFTPGYNGGKPWTSGRNGQSPPEQHDWRLYGAVNPVKDQAVCGSCWSFGTTGTIEGVYFVKTGHLVRLSEQQLIDCSWQQGDNGCDGGEDFRAYEYIQRTGGIALNDDYGGYMGQDGKCHDTSVRKAVQLDGFYNVTAYDAEALRLAIFENGPVTVAINANPKAFTFYSNGVFSDPSCSGKPEDLDHQVLAVGYGQLNGQKYWLIKNSWSTYWGNAGYVLIAQNDNMCGVTTSPTYPNIKL